MLDIKIGILGTSEVARRSIIDVSKNMQGVTILAIASRDLLKAKDYARHFQIPQVFDSYDDLLLSNEINAVYIPLISSLHFEYTLKAINCGKHVLVEKPICFNKHETVQLEKALANNKDLIILEGLMSQHHPWIDTVKEIVKGGLYGGIKSIRTRASYQLEDIDDFRNYPEKGGSVFYEEGIIWCHLTQTLLDLSPKEMNFNVLKQNSFGADTEIEVKMLYEGGVFSECYCSYNDPYESNHWIEFEGIIIKINNFWRPTFGVLKLNCEIINKETKESQPLKFERCSYFKEQLIFFVEAIRGVRKNIPLQESLERIELMDRLYSLSDSHMLF